MEKNITLKNLRPALPAVVQNIDVKMERYVVSKRGKPTVMMLSIADFLSLQETLEVLSDTTTVKRISGALAEIKKGQTESWESIKKRHKLSSAI